MIQQWASEIGKKPHPARIDENLKESVRIGMIAMKTPGVAGRC